MKTNTIFLTILLTLITSFVSAKVKPVTVKKLAGKPVVYRDGKPILFAGIQYWGLDYWSINNWDKDIAKIKSLGFNGVRLNIAWDHIELKDNQFDFKSLDALLDKLDKANLMVVLQMNQSAHEWKPKWFTDRYPAKDLEVRDNKGKGQYGRLSFSSKPLKEHYYDYIKKTVAHIKDRECIIAYSVYTEPHFADKAQWVDFNHYNKRAFRAWLKKKYNNDVNALNTAWNTNFQSINKASPYKKTPNEEWENMPVGERKWFLDWRIWNCVAKERFIGSLVRECKKIDSKHLYIQNMMWKWELEHSATVALDPEINYAYADIMGINTYPMPHNHDKVGHQVNFIRTMHKNKKPVWLGEFNLKSGEANQKDLSGMLSEAYKAGCSGFVYFTYNGQAEISNREFGIEHYGVLDRNRNNKKSFYEIKKYLQEEFVGKEEAILNQPVAKADAYFLWSKENKFYTYLDKDYCLRNYISARTWLTIDKGYSLDILTESQFVSGNFDKSKPVIVPSLPFTNEKVAKKLNEYVTKEGLCAFLTGRFGEHLTSENSKVIKKGYPRTDKYLGLKFTGVEKEKIGKVKLKQSFYKLSKGVQVKPKSYKVNVQPSHNTEVLAKWTDGTPALLKLSKGKGSILYYGTHFFNSDRNYNRAFNANLLKAFIRMCEEKKAH